MTPRCEYPRPDFERDNWLSLNGEWAFSIGQKTYDRTIVVPFACETALSGIGACGFHRQVFYRRSVTLPETMHHKRIILHFGAVDYLCRVWVNGQFIQSHTGGQTAFSMDISHAICPEEPFVIEVEAQDDPFDMEMPRGKQFWEERPRSIFYDRTTGIWQSVWLEAVEPLHLTRCLITPLVDERAVRFEFELSQPGPCELETELYFEKRPVTTVRVKCMADSGSFTVELNQTALGEWNFRECLCWTPENPRLFHVTYRLYEDGGECDCVRSYFGMRKVSIENGVFMLNNVPYYQKLVLDQGYWPESLLTAPDDAAFVRDIELTKAMGFNGVRKHQKVEDPRYLYHADRLGLLVWGEIGASYVYSRRAAQRLYGEWQQAVLDQYNHPCIVAWTPLNESWGVQEIGHSVSQQAHAQALYHLTRSLDATRPVISNDGWEHVCSDLLTIHDYTSNGQTLSSHFACMSSVLRLHPGGRALFAQGASYEDQPVLVSEYGGIKYAPNRPSDSSWGYCETADGTQFEAKFGELTGALLASPHVQGYCYTQLTDVGTEKNGLLTENREPKIPLQRLRILNDGK